MDYSSGVDISNYRNIKVPTSYMGVNSRYDFEGGYENDTKCGMLHVASHHVSPGKKQWTWGNGDFGRAWDRNLTDSDGPYIELMAGVYTENQPDFAWLQPYEEKRFTQYFFPYRELGVVKNATRDFVFNIIEEDGDCVLKLFSTITANVRIKVSHRENGEVVYECESKVSPRQILTLALGSEHNPKGLRVEVYDGDGRIALFWEAEEDEAKPIPSAAVAAPAPEDIKSNDRLYQTGVHLEQYRHATFSAQDYYEEALRRDPADIRCNNAMGLWYLRRGRYETAEKYIRRAVSEQCRYNPNPYDGEPRYNLGVALMRQGRNSEAYDCFSKAAWNAAWQDAAWYACACIATGAKDYETALEDIDNSLARNSLNHKAQALKALILMKMERKDEAVSQAEEALKMDAFNYAAMVAKAKTLNSETVKSHLAELMRDEAHNYNVVGIELMTDGCYEEAEELWMLAEERGAVDPMSYYHLARCRRNGGLSGVEDAFNKALKMSPDYCFPKGNDAIISLLQASIELNNDWRCRYYLGCIYYDARQYDLAIKYWEEAVEIEDKDPYLNRNLALARFNKQHREAESIALMESAVELSQGEPRMVMELDQLYKRMHRSGEFRLRKLREYPGVTEQRDALRLEEATLLNLLGHHEEAKDIIDGRKFHPWEGGEGKVSCQYQFCRLEMAKEAILHGLYPKAESLLEECLVYPENLGEGKLEGAQDNDFHYLLGCIAKLRGDLEKATRHFTFALSGPTEPSEALYYNDAKADKIFYQGLAYRELGNESAARSAFNRLKSFGERTLFEPVKIDYFAVSLPDLLIWEEDLQQRNTVYCRYLMALGCYGLGEKERALRELNRVIELDPNHQGAIAMKSMMSIDEIIMSNVKL